MTIFEVMMYSSKVMVGDNIISVRKKCVLFGHVSTVPRKEKFYCKLGDKAKAYLLSKFKNGFFTKNLLELLDEIWTDDGWFYFKMWKVSNIKDLVTLLVYSRSELIGFVLEPTIQMSWIALEKSVSYSRVTRVINYIHRIEKFYEDDGTIVENNKDLSILFDSMASDKLEPQRFKRIRNVTVR